MCNAEPNALQIKPDFQNAVMYSLILFDVPDVRWKCVKSPVSKFGLLIDIRSCCVPDRLCGSRSVEGFRVTQHDIYSSLIPL